MKQLPHKTLRHAIHFRQLVLIKCRVLISNFLGFFIRKLAKCSATFFGRINGVISLSSKKQVIGINTSWIITMVQHVQSFWRQMSMFQKKCCSVRSNFWTGTPRSNYSISQSPLSFVSWTSPFPTRAKFWSVLRSGSVFVNVGPKTSSEGCGKPLRKGGVLDHCDMRHKQVAFDLCFGSLPLRTRHGSNCVLLLVK